MKNLLVVVVILTVFFGLFIYVGTHTPLLKNTPFYWVAQDMSSLVSSIFGALGNSVVAVSYPTLKKLHLVNNGKWALPFIH